MEPIGFCGGGCVALGLLLTLISGLVVVAGGLVLALARLGVFVDRLARTEDRDKPDTNTPEQSNAPEKDRDKPAN